MDVLVNNAGVMRSTPVASSDLEDLRQILDVNLFDLIATTREALPYLAERGGHVANLSSVAAIRPESIKPGCAASKAGLNAFSETLRKK